MGRVGRPERVAGRAAGGPASAVSSHTARCGQHQRVARCCQQHKRGLGDLWPHRAVPNGRISRDPRSIDRQMRIARLRRIDLCADIARICCCQQHGRAYGSVHQAEWLIRRPAGPNWGPSHSPHGLDGPGGRWAERIRRHGPRASGPRAERIRRHGPVPPRRAPLSPRQPTATSPPRPRNRQGSRVRISVRRTSPRFMIPSPYKGGNHLCVPGPLRVRATIVVALVAGCNSPGSSPSVASRLIHPSHRSGRHRHRRQPPRRHPPRPGRARRRSRPSPSGSIPSVWCRVAGKWDDRLHVHRIRSRSAASAPALSGRRTPGSLRV